MAFYVSMYLGATFVLVFMHVQRISMLLGVPSTTIKQRCTYGIYTEIMSTHPCSRSFDNAASTPLFIISGGGSFDGGSSVGGDEAGRLRPDTMSVCGSGLFVLQFSALSLSLTDLREGSASPWSVV